MSPLLILCTFILIFLIEIAYFRIAEHYNIIDKPNHRSSHTSLVLRGGGIIFTIGLLIYPFYFGFGYGYFLFGLLGIAFISFLDDLKPVNNKLRIVFHLASVALMFYQLSLFNLPIYWIVLAFVFVIGSINAINFMDGINGITGSYALITLSTLLYINTNKVEFIDSSILITSILTLFVFNLFNFRTKARCFAGDVGSVSIAFIIMFFLLKLIIKTEDFSYLLFLLLYGLDSVTTIFFRLIRKENIFDAHRTHFYQYWANERRIPHLVVASFYAGFQVIINILVLSYFTKSIFIIFLSLLISVCLFIISRFLTEGSARLLKT